MRSIFTEGGDRMQNVRPPSFLGRGIISSGSKVLFLICILRGIELQLVTNRDSVSVSVSYRYERIFNRKRTSSNYVAKETFRTTAKQATNLSVQLEPHFPETTPTSPTPNDDPVKQEICYAAPNGTCRLVPCPTAPPNFSAARPAPHYRGLSTRDVSPSRFTAPAMCGVCRAYGVQCAVSTQHRFIYIHVMKSGGSSAHLFLKSALCPLANASSPPRRPAARDYACEPHLFKLMDCNTALRRHPRFFRWTIVRHPVPRAVSGWAMASRRPAGGAGPVDFNAWAGNSSLLPTKVWPMHWQPQTDFLLDQRGCPMYHYAATMGNRFAADMEVVLRRVNATALWEVYRRGGLPREYASADAVRETAYSNLSAAATAALLERYRADFDTFGFRTAGWREEGFF